MRIIIISALLCIIALDIQGQSLVDLNPVTITSARTAQKVSETGRNITVIEGKQFQQLPVSSVDELLKYVPGIEVQSRGPMGAQSDIVMRGGTFQQVLVLLDGIKLNDPLTGHFSSYIPVAPYEIERIEVLRGPAAAIYGAEAVGGVVNIITKTFNQFRDSTKTDGLVSVAVGEFNLLNADAGIRHTSGKINFSAGLLSNNTDGQLLRGTNKGYIHNHTFGGALSILLPQQWQLSLRSGFDSRRFAAQNYYTTFKSDTATEKVDTWWNQLQLKKQQGGVSQQFDLMYKQAHDHYLFNSVSIANDNRSKHLVLQYLRTQSISKTASLSMGSQVDRRSIISNDRGNHATHHGAVFSTLLVTKKRFRISPGLRLDWDENYGVALLPQLSTSYQLKNFTFRANAGRAIRSADYTERFNNYNKALVPSGTIGNPDLNTENSWSYEAGADIYAGNNFKLSVTGFYRDQNNVIDFVATPYAEMPRKDNLVPGSVYALAKNIKKVSTRGVETTLTWQTTLGQHQSIFISSGVTFLRSASSDGIPSFYIISHAKTLLQSTLIYTCKNLSITSNFVYKYRGAQQASAINASLSRDYFLLNGKISYTFFNKARLFIAVNNIADVNYSDLLGSIMPGRWTSGGISVNF
ncbi:MAG: TonB-dependent receptor [Bacteroidota bacterium]